MEERNKVIFQLYQNTILYSISTSLIGNKINFVCTDSNSKTYEGSYSLSELNKISKYFKLDYTLEQTQLYLNGIIEKQKISISRGDAAVTLILYLINHDTISIPLSFKRAKINNFNNINQNVSQINIHQKNKNKDDTKINELQRQLKEEKEKNKKLININENLKETINELNNNLNKIMNINEKLEKDLAQKNIEIQKLLSKKKANKSYFDLSSLKLDDKIIGVNFVSMGRNDIGHYNIVCKNRDLFVRLEERLYEDFPQFKEYETYFEVNGKRIKRFKTLEQNNIKTNDIVNIFIIDE